MNKFTVLAQLPRIKRASILLGILFLGQTVQAQKIDFDQSGRRTDEVTQTGFSSWQVGQLSYNGSASTTVNGVRVTVKNSTNGYDLRTGWYKANILKDKLINDGIHHDGNPRRGTSITITVSGLSNGNHSIQAYHNNPDGVAGMGNITVVVNGRKKAVVAPSSRAASTSQAAKSYVSFSGSSATIVYSSNTDFYINSLEFDVADANAQATSPYPANQEFHANADNGSIALRWSPAKNGANSQVLYWSTDKNAVANGSANRVNLSGNASSYNLSGLSPLKRYYWRVDEIKNGTTSKGEVWAFQPRRLAFPGAEGYGKYAIGGRGGIVYHVTNLRDDNSYGSFRYGVTKLSGPRTIVFDVAGVITLTSRLTISDPYITIAGQTAPGRGIMFRSKALGVATDGITRFIRLRLGGGDSWSGSGANQNTMDGIGMAGNNNSIMDHCSISWTIDEAFSSRNAKNVTLQRTLISEALNYAGHSHYVEQSNRYVEHGYAATIGGGEGGVEGAGSYHHNLLAHNEGRNWSMSGGLDGNGYYDGHHDMFNNVVYNWGGRTTDGGTHEGNFVNNYYKMGPSSTEQYLLTANLEGTGKGTQSYYVSGNIRENLNHSKTTDQNQLRRYVLSGGQKLNWTVFQNKPFFPSLANIESSEAAFKNVLSDVGCNMPELDNHDQRMVRETLNGTYSKTGHYTKKKGLIDRESDSEGFNGLNITYAQRPSNWDTDNDGMPDWWEKAYGTNPNVADNNGDLNNDGYTNLEEYLNWAAEPHFEINGKTQVNLGTYFAGYTRPSYRVSYTDNGAVAGISGNTLTVYNGSAKALFVVKVTASQDGVSLTRTFNFYVTGGTAGGNQPTEKADKQKKVNETVSVPASNKEYSGTIHWNFDNGTANQSAEVSKDFEGYLTASTSLGENLVYGGVKQLTNLNETRVGVKVQQGVPTGKNALSFNVQPAKGCAFTPTRVDFTATRIGTDGGLIDANWDYVELGTKLHPARNKENPEYTTYTYNVKGDQSNNLKSLILYLYQLETSKQFGIANVTIYGKLSRPAKAEEAQTENGTIKWKFDQGNAGQQAVVGNDLQGYVTTDVQMASGLTYGGTKELSGLTETRIGVTVDNDPAPSNDNKLSFVVSPVEGYSLNITRIEFTATRIGTDGGNIDVSWAGSKIASGLRPARNKANPEYTTYTYNVSTANPQKGHKLTFNFYNIGITKQFGLANIKLYGTLQTAGAKANGFGVTDGIENVEISLGDNNPWYTLSGMKVEKPSQPGLYIHNGKKVMINK